MQNSTVMTTAHAIVKTIPLSPRRHPKREEEEEEEEEEAEAEELRA